MTGELITDSSDNGVNIDPLNFSQWGESAGAGITEPKNRLIGYGNYLREFEFERGTLDRDTEEAIRNNILPRVAQIDPEYKLEADAGTVDTDASLIYEAFGQQAKDNYYDALNNGGAREDFVDEVNEAKQHLVEHGKLSLASLRRTGEDGTTSYELIGDSTILDSKKAIADSIRRGAIGHKDMWQVSMGMENVHKGVTAFKAIRDNQVRTEFSSASQSEEDKELYKEVLSEAKDYFINKKEDDEPSALITKARTLLAKQYSRGKNISESASRNRFQDSDIMDALEQVATFESYQTGEAKYEADIEKLGDNIKVTKNGAVIPHIELLLDRGNFEAALAQRTDLTRKQRSALVNFRKDFLTRQFPYYDDLFSDSTVENKWGDAKIQGKQEGLSNGEILENFLTNPKNYSGAKNRMGAVADSIVDSFTGLAFVIPALFEHKGATDFLVAQEEDRQNRRAVAKLFGDDFGFVMDVSTALAPMITDVTATALLSAGTFGAGGAIYLGAKQGANITAKGVAKSLTGSILTKRFGEDAGRTAARLRVKGYIGKSAKLTDVKKAINDYNKLLTKTVTKKGVEKEVRSSLVAGVQTSALFLTAANRSAGATYTTVYSNIDGTHEEKHDAALGAALTAGMATGMITAGFSSVGAGGFEDAFLRGITYKQHRSVLERMKRSKIARSEHGEAMRTWLSGRIKEVVPQVFPDIYRRFLKSGTEEFFEEAIDEFVNSFIVDAALNEDTPMIERVSAALYAGAIGGVIGQGAAGVRSIAEKRGAFARGELEMLRQSEEAKLIENLKENNSPLTANALMEGITRQQLRATEMRAMPKDFSTMIGTAIEESQKIADARQKVSDEELGISIRKDKGTKAGKLAGLNKETGEITLYIQDIEKDFNADEPLPYLAGDVDSKTSQQKKEVFKDVDLAKLKKKLSELGDGGSEGYIKFIEEHERAHAQLRHREKYPDDLMDPAAIDMEREANEKAAEAVGINWKDVQKVEGELPTEKTPEQKAQEKEDLINIIANGDKEVIENTEAEVIADESKEGTKDEDTTETEEPTDEAAGELDGENIDPKLKKQIEILTTVNEDSTPQEQDSLANLQGTLNELVLLGRAFGVDVKLVSDEQRKYADDIGRPIKPFSHVVTETEVYIRIEPRALGALIDGLSNFSARSLAGAGLMEEVIHHATLAELTPEELTEVYQSLSQEDIDFVIDSYYTKEEDREAARARLQQTDVEVQEGFGWQSEQRTLAKETLRIHAQRILSGTTTEQDADFFKGNPNLLSIFVRHLKKIGAKLQEILKGKHGDNPVLRKMTYRVIAAYNDMRSGYATEYVPPFDPDNPLKVIHTFEGQTKVSEADRDMDPVDVFSLEQETTAPSGPLNVNIRYSWGRDDPETLARRKTDTIRLNEIPQKLKELEDKLILTKKNYDIFDAEESDIKDVQEQIAALEKELAEAERSPSITWSWAGGRISDTIKVKDIPERIKELEYELSSQKKKIESVRGTSHEYKGWSQSALDNLQEKIDNLKEAAAAVAPVDTAPPVYTAAILDDSGDALNFWKFTLQQPLLSRLYAHHMTIDFKPTAEQFSATPIGDGVELKVVGYASDSKVQVLAVKPVGVVSSNAVAHITIATDGTTSPAYSNELLEKGYTEVDGPTIKARVGYVDSKGVDHFAPRRTAPAPVAEPNVFYVEREKGKKVTDSVQDAEDAGDGINVLRKWDVGEKHFGNPFSHRGFKNTIRTKNLEQTVEYYRKWLEGDEDFEYKDKYKKRREWILGQIDSGALDGKNLLYYDENIQPNHAEALKDFVIKRRAASKVVPSKTYKGEVTSLDKNQVFVFGSNLQGFHGAGAAGYASFNEKKNVWRKHGYDEWKDGTEGKWNIKGQAEGLQDGTDGTSYALPTKQTATAKRSLSPEEITENIRKLYATARSKPDKEFLVAQKTKMGLSGWTGAQMAKMYLDAGDIPSNIVFEEGFHKLLRDMATPRGFGKYAPKGFEGFEVSRAGKDEEGIGVKFSAKNARLPSGKTIEYVWQKEAKQSGKGLEAKDKNFPYWETYKGLWAEYFIANQNALAEIGRASSGKVLTDKFGGDGDNVNTQARAIHEILVDLKLRDPMTLKYLGDGGTPAVERVLHSGGAAGADTEFENAALEAGFKVEAHSFKGHAKGNKHRTPHTAEELKEADEHLAKANETLDRAWPTKGDFVNNLLRRNWFQVKDSDQVIAVSRIEGGQVKGGTAWASQMGIDQGKEVHVFDMRTNKWHRWDGTAYVKSDPPALSDKFAGIGSRDITARGKEEIRKLFTAKKEASAIEITESQIVGEGETPTIFKHGDLTAMLTLPMLKTGKYKGHPKGIMKWLAGGADPRLQRLNQQATALRNAVFNEIQKYKDMLDYLVAKEYPDGDAPVELFKDITGDGETLKLEPEIHAFIEQKYRERKVVLNNKRLALIEDKESEQRNKELEEVLEEINQLEDNKELAYKRAYQNKKALIAQRRHNAILQLGGYEEDGTPKGAIALHLLELRKKTDAFSKQIASLFPNDKEIQKTLKATIDGNLEIYLTRSYKLFSEAGFADKVLHEDKYLEVRKEAAEFFEQEYINARSAQILRNSEKFTEESIKLDVTDDAKVGEVVTRLGDAEIIAKAELSEGQGTTSTEMPPKIHNMMIEFLNSYSTGDKLLIDPNKMVRDENKRIGFSAILKEKLKGRKNIPDALRQLMGEEGDSTGYDAIMRTYMHVGIMASHQAFLKNLLDFGLKAKNRWIITGAEHTNLAPEEKAKWRIIMADGDARYDPFVMIGKNESYFAPKEMVESLKEMRDSVKLSMNEAEQVGRAMTKAAQVLTGSSMAAKTLGSIGFYLRNALSNVLFFGPAQGIIAPVALTKSMVKEIGRKKGFFFEGKLGPEKLNEYYSKLDALDIIGDEIRPKMLDEIFSGESTPNDLMNRIYETTKEINDLSDESTTPEDLKKAGTALHKAYTNLKEMSAAMDTFYKIYYFEHELAVLKKAKADSIAKGRDDDYARMTENQLERAAADIVLDTAQSYSRSSPFVRGWVKSPVGVMFAPFVRFKTEVVRIGVNTIRRSIREIKDSNPVIRRRGLRRLTGMTGVTVGISAIFPLLLRLGSGVEDEEDAALRRTLVEYLKNHTFYMHKDEEGNLWTTDFTYLNPFSLVVDPFLRSFEIGSTGGSAGEMGFTFVKSMIFDEYLDDQIFAGALLSLKSNRDPQTNKKIWEQRDTAEDVFMKGTFFLLKEAFEPRTLKAGREAMKLMGTNPVEDALARIGREFLPVKPFKVDLRRNMRRYLFDIRRETQNISLRKNIVLSDTPLSDNEIKGLVLDEIDHRVRLDKETAHTLKHLASLGGMTDEEVRNIVYGAQFGKRRYKFMLNGLTETPRETHKGLKKKLRDKYEATGNSTFLRRERLLDSYFKNIPRFYRHDDN